MPDNPEDPKRGVTTFDTPAQPFVHPGVPQQAVNQAAVFSAAQQEAQRKAKQRANALPKADAPRAGGEGPPIPHLAGGNTGPGVTMAQAAASERGPRQVQPAGLPGRLPGPGEHLAGPPEAHTGFVQPAGAGQAVFGANQAPPSPAQLGLRPTDELPAEATNDPNFRQGTGSMFAVSQPELAMRYGIVRGGQHITPQQLQNPVDAAQPRTLSPKSVQDLEELQRLQERQQQDAVAVTGGPGSGPTEMGAAAGGVGTPQLTDEDREDIKQSLDSLDEFDFDAYRQSLMKDVLNNNEQRTIIEARLEEMDVGDLITQGYLIQKVPIIPDKFWVEFKVLEGETDLALKRIIMEDSLSVDVSDRYYLDKFGLMSLAAVIHKVNDKPYSGYMDAEGNFDDALFREKFKRVLKLPMPMLASLGANAMWFDVRVRKLFVAEKLGNG